MQNPKKVTIFYLKRALYKVAYGRQRIRFFFFSFELKICVGKLLLGTIAKKIDITFHTQAS